MDPGNPPATPQEPPPPKRPPVSRPFAIHYFGVLCLIVLSPVWAVRLGYANGLNHDAGDTGSPLALLLLVLVPLQILLLKKTWGKRGDEALAFLFIVMPVVQAVILLILFDTAWNVRFSEKRSMVSREKADMRSISNALESYHGAHGAFPPSLDRLTVSQPTGQTAYMGALPRSAFGDLAALYQAVAAPNQEAPASQPCSWMVWMPGPTGVYAIEPGPEVAEAIENFERSGGQYTPWLADRLYDPTNGASGGDIVRMGGK